MTAPILFYKARGPYRSFTNFSRDPVAIFGRTWLTSEHAFQAMKFWPHRPDLFQKVFDAKTPSEAAAIGRDRSLPLHPQWEAEVRKFDDDPQDTTMVVLGMRVDDGRGLDFVVSRYKDVVMFLVVLAKFSQDPEIAEVLLGTGHAPIIEDTRESGDAYWGWGRDTHGVNRLGKILMGARTVLRSGEAMETLTNGLADYGLNRK